MGLVHGDKSVSRKLALTVALSASLGACLSPRSMAQEDSSGSTSSSSSGSSSAEKELTPINPLQGLFQMQPQYPTPGTTQMFPEAVSTNMGKDSDVQGRHPGQSSPTFQTQWKDPYAAPEDKNVTTVNPLKGLFQMQPQYPTPGTTQMFPEATPKHLGDDSSVQGRHPGQSSPTFQTQWKDPYAAPEADHKDKTNYIQGLFQMQPQFATPGKTVMFPEAVQHNLGSDAEQQGRQPGSTAPLHQFTWPTTTEAPSETPENKESLLSGEGKKEGDKKEGDKKEGDKKEGDKKEGDKKEGDKKEGDKKEGDKKEGDKKEGDKKEGDKKEGDKKEGDKKEGDKKEGDKKEGDKKEGDKKEGDKKEGDKKEGDKKEGDKKEEEKKEVKYAPYNPLREAISLMNSGKFQESIDLLSREIKKVANNPQAYYTRAVAYVRMRKYDMAAQDYKEVLKLTPQGPMADLARNGLSKIHF